MSERTHAAGSAGAAGASGMPQAGDGRHTPSGPRAARKRQDILAAARTLFLRDGFDASVDLIAAQAGVSKVTVYNHFGSKQALFVEVVKDSLDAPLGDTLVSAVDALGESDDLRTALTAAARSWVAEVRADRDMLAVRTLVAREAHRFPELHEAWRHGGGPAVHHPAAGAALARLTATGRLDIPDPDVAIMQLYSLLVFPHLVFSAYGTEVDDDFADRLVTGGVEMFLACYTPRRG
ncbi:TetR/AcrR family transcriptional regulator [Streptomyces sp. V4-01]|uniref:TetR/AcrR family transcriptional regulator n=1 Tax=Actinacidiphila polyblastidii TaxID=3110430 RepID=A0ABU7PHQ0_9ACTN|nr:TetR/AcrR family transcriptional regulator [Streptomyces sp. V4-01]